MSEIKYSLKNGNGKELVLMAGEQMSRCPFTPPFQVQGIGGMGMAHIPCSTLCPHASITTEGDVTFYNITCGGEKVKIQLSEKSTDGEPKSEGSKSPFSVV